MTKIVWSKGGHWSYLAAPIVIELNKFTKTVFTYPSVIKTNKDILISGQTNQIVQ